MDGTIEADVVRGLWAEVLGAPVDGEDPSFFEAGGDSISALTLIFRIQEEQGLGVDVGDLFEAPTLSAFTRRLNTLRASGS